MAIQLHLSDSFWWDHNLKENLHWLWVRWGCLKSLCTYSSSPASSVWIQMMQDSREITRIIFSVWTDTSERLIMLRRSWTKTLFPNCFEDAKWLTTETKSRAMVWKKSPFFFKRGQTKSLNISLPIHLLPLFGAIQIYIQNFRLHLISDNRLSVLKFYPHKLQADTRSFSGSSFILKHFVLLICHFFFPASLLTTNYRWYLIMGHYNNNKSLNKIGRIWSWMASIFIGAYGGRKDQTSHRQHLTWCQGIPCCRSSFCFIHENRYMCEMLFNVIVTVLL